MKLRRAPLSVVATGLLAAAVVSGCTGRYESDFPVLVVNRTANQLQALANGNAIGDVAAGQTGSFSLNLPESNANIFVNGTAPTPRADVTFTARDARTGALSSEKSVVLTKGNTTTVSFAADDFPSTGATIARFTFSPTNPTINQDVSFNGSSSSVSNGTYAWDFGDGQSGTGATTTHRYTRNGTFTITLAVTSDTRATSTSSRTITISATLPAATANFTFSPTQPAINQDVSFTGNAQVPGGPGGGGGGRTSPGSHLYLGLRRWNLWNRHVGDPPVHPRRHLHGEADCDERSGVVRNHHPPNHGLHHAAGRLREFRVLPNRSAPR